MATERAAQLIDRATRAKNGRDMWTRHWEDLSWVQLPRRRGFVTDVIPGDHRVDDVFDGTPMNSATRLANKLGGIMRPEGQPWFFVKPVEDADEGTDEAKEWLADTEDRMRQAISNPDARARQAMGETDIDLVVLGTGVLKITEQVQGNFNSLFFQSQWLGDAIPEFDDTGKANAMFFFRHLTIRQAIDKFGRDNLSERTRELVGSDSKEERFNEKIQFLFVVTPRENGRPDAILARNLPWADIVIEVMEKHEVKVGGFHEFPYVVPRWDTMSGEDYGRSPGMIALPDSNSAQAIGETMLIAGQRAADPALLTPSDAFIDPPHTFPGGLAVYEGEAVRELGGARNAIIQLEPGHNFPLTRELQQDMREQIRTAFLLNLFNLPQAGDATMTATEVIARLEEFIQEAGPVFGRLETDYTAPTVERVFNIMLRGGGFLPIPEALQGRGIRFEYESPIKRIREQKQSVAAQLWVADKVNIATSTGDQSILDNVNFDAYAQFDATANNIPHQLINGENKIQEIRQARAEAEEEAAEMQQAQEIAKTAKDAGAAIGAVAPAP